MNNVCNADDKKIIKAADVSYEYTRYEEDGTVAIKNISFEIEEGSFNVIIGQNGSGKSTLAKHFNALLTPTEGVIIVDGFDTKEEKLQWEIRKSVGMVFQNPDNQLVASVVEEDVAFGLENLGVEREEMIERVNSALLAVGMSEYAKYAPHYLSGGQKQRVSIAGVLAMRPKIIVFDEVTAMLDPEGRREIMKTAHMLNKEYGITVIHITHYMEEAIDADKIIVMSNSELIMKGTPREIFARVAELEAIGLTVPVITKLAQGLIDEGLDIPQAILTEEELVEAICQLK
ncbi:MAG: energy-coupling factor transporter ATPase [Clostridiales bacterium]|nr:energy-coupling factor transporter ATPase [Clostridiales bacterium]